MITENLVEGEYYMFIPPYSGQTWAVFEYIRKQNDESYIFCKISPHPVNDFTMAGAGLGRMSSFNRIEVSRYISDEYDLTTYKTKQHDKN